MATAKQVRRRTMVGLLLVAIIAVGLVGYIALGRTYTVSFNTRGAEYVRSISVSPRHHQNLDDVIPINPGYVFMGWMPTETSYGTYVSNTSELGSTTTLFAHWVPENFLARLYVDGINYRNINLIAGQHLGHLPNEDWFIEVDSRMAFSQFLGWEFFDILGNRSELRWTDEFEGPRMWVLHSNLTWDQMTQQYVPERSHAITPAEPFRPELYDMTFNAIVQWRDVALVFEGGATQPITALQFNDEIAMPRFVNTMQPNFAGWRMTRVNNDLHTMGTDNLTGSITSIVKPGHTSGYAGTVRDLRNLNEMFTRIYSEFEVLNIDSLLYYVSRPLAGFPTTRAIHFEPVFWNADRVVDSDDPLYNRSITHSAQFLIRGLDGGLTEIPTTTDGDAHPSTTSIPARLEPGARVVLYRPATVAGRTFRYFQYFDGQGNLIRLDDTAMSWGIYLPGHTDSILHPTHATIFEAVWDIADQITITFDYGRTEFGTGLRFINYIETEQGSTIGTPVENETDVVTSVTQYIGQEIILPSVAMFAMANRSFSHWEDPNGNFVGVAGQIHVVAGDLIDPETGGYTLVARWVDNRANFAFDLNGGRDFAPDVSIMRGTPGQSVNMPEGQPIRYGYNFTGWMLGDTVVGQTVTIQNRRQVIVAQWAPRPVTINLNYTFVENGMVRERPISINVPFDSTIQLRRITTPEFTQSAQLVGWRFTDRLNTRNMDFAPTQSLRIDEAFAVRATGSFDDTDLFTRDNGVINGREIKEGRDFDVTFFGDMGEHVVGDNFHNGTGNVQLRFMTQQWRGGIPGPDGEPGSGRSNTVSRQQIYTMINNTAGETFEHYRRLQITHELTGVLFIPDALAGSMLSNAAGWTSVFNPNTGDFTGGSLGLPSIHHDFTRDGDGNTVNLRLYLWNENMRIYPVWTPREVEVEVVLPPVPNGVDEVTPTIPSTFTGDRREHASLMYEPLFRVATDPIESINPDTGATETRFRFSTWSARFEFRHPTRMVGGERELLHYFERSWTPDRSGTLSATERNWFFSVYNAAPWEYVGDDGTLVGLAFPVTRIVLTRVVQDLTTFVMRVEDSANMHPTRNYFGVATMPFQGNESLPNYSPFGYTDGIGSLFPNIRNEDNMVDFRIGGVLPRPDLGPNEYEEFTPGMRGLQIDNDLRAAAQTRGQRVSHFRTADGQIFFPTNENTPVMEVRLHGGNPAGGIVGPGAGFPNLPIVGHAVEDEHGVIRDHSGNEIDPDNVPAGLLAFINADVLGSVTLQPVFTALYYHVFIYFETDGSNMPTDVRERLMDNPHTESVPNTNYFRVRVPGRFGDAGTPASAPGLNNIVLNTPGFTGAPGSITGPGTLWRDMLQSHFGHFAQLNMPNVGPRVDGTVVPMFALNSNHSFNIGSGTGPGPGYTQLDFNWATGANFNEIHLHLDWRPQQIQARFHWQSSNAIQISPATNIGYFGSNVNLWGDDDFPTSPRRLGYTLEGWTTNSTFDARFGFVGALGGTVHAGDQPGGTPQIGNFYMNPPAFAEVNSTFLNVDLYAAYLGLPMPVQFILVDVDNAAARPTYVHNDAFSTENRFGLADPTEGPDSARNVFTPQNISGMGTGLWALNLPDARFGDQINLDERPTAFHHGVSANIFFQYWYYNTFEAEGSGFVQVPRRIVPTSAGLIFNLNDLSLIDPITNTWRNNPSVFQIHSRFTQGDTPFFAFDTSNAITGRARNNGTVGGTSVWNEEQLGNSVSQMQNGEDGLLRDILNLHVAPGDYFVPMIDRADPTGYTGDYIFHVNDRGTTPTQPGGADDWALPFHVNAERTERVANIDVTDGFNIRTINNPMNLYQTLIYNSNPASGPVVDNRFIRFGYELIGFSAVTNAGHVTDEHIRERYFFSPAFITSVEGAQFSAAMNIPTLTVSNNTLFRHAFIRADGTGMAPSVVLRPIWRAMNVELMMFMGDTTLEHTELTNWPRDVLGMPTSAGQPNWTGFPSQGRLVTTFEDVINLPLLDVAAEDSGYFHTGFRWAETQWYLNNTPGFPIEWNNFRDYFVRPLDTELARRDYNHGLRESWPKIWFEAQWQETFSVTVNFHMAHRDLDTGDMIFTNPNELPSEALETRIVSMAPTRINVGTTANPVWEWKTQLVGSSLFLITEFRLPNLDDLDLDNGPDLYGLTSRGWYSHRGLTDGFRLGAEGDMLRFRNGDRQTAWNNNTPVTFIPGGMGGVVPFETDLYLLYDYARGHIEFRSEGGPGTLVPPPRQNVLQGEEIFFNTQAETSIIRYGRSFLGWRFAGHLTPTTAGTSVVVPYQPYLDWVAANTSSHHSLEFPFPIYTAVNPFTVQFTALPVMVVNETTGELEQLTDGNGDPVYRFQDGAIIIMQAVWHEVLVPIVFHNDASIPGVIQGDFDGVSVLYGTRFLDADVDGNADFLPFLQNNHPIRAGHRFEGWYFTPTAFMPNPVVQNHHDVQLFSAIDPSRNVVDGPNYHHMVDSQVAVNLHARFVPNHFRFNFNANHNDATFPAGNSRPTATETLPAFPGTGFERAYTFGSRIDNLLDIQIVNPMARFVGWSLTTDDVSNVMNPALGVSAVRLGSSNAATSDEFILDVDTAMRAGTPIGTNPDGSLVFEITLHAIWSQEEVMISYIAGAGATGATVAQAAYLFVDGIRHIVGGDNAMTIGANAIDHRTYGVMVVDATGFDRPGYNFLGWLPTQAARVVPGTNPLGRFLGHGTLDRIFFPGEFLPSIRESMTMVAVWVPHGPLTATPTLIASNVSLDGLAENSKSIHSIAAITTPITTAAQIVLVPRGAELARSTIVATNAVHVGLPAPLTRGGESARLAPGAIITAALEWVFINDGLVGFDGPVVGNIITGSVNPHTGAVISAFREYIVAQGNLVLTFMDGSTTNVDTDVPYVFTHRTTKYRFDAYGQTWGILYTAGSTRTLLGFPSARASDAVGTIGPVEMAGVTALAPYAFAYLNSGITTINVTGVQTIPSRAFYNINNVATLRLPNNPDLVIAHDFVAGFNPALASVRFGTTNEEVLELNGDRTIETFEFMGVPSMLVETIDGDISRIIYTLTSADFMTTEVNMDFTTGEVQINEYALWNFVPIQMTELRIGGFTPLLGTQEGLRRAHFFGTAYAYLMASLPHTLQEIFVGENIRELDWTLVASLTLPRGMTIEYDPTASRIRLAGHAGILSVVGGANGFPVFLSTLALANTYQNATASNLARIEGNSRFQTRAKTLTFNSGDSNDEFALGALEFEHMTAWGMPFTFPAPRADFVRPGYAFIGWKLVMNADQIAAGTPPYIIFPRGDTRTLAMTFTNTTMYVQSTATFIAQWRVVYAEFIGLERVSQAFEMFDEIEVNANIGIANAAGDDVTRMSSGHSADMSIHGTRFFMAHTDQGFIGPSGHHYGIVGWTTVARSATFDIDEWMWDNAADATRIMPIHPQHMTPAQRLAWLHILDEDNFVTFYALYGRRSPNIEFVASTMTHDIGTMVINGVAAQRNTTIEFEQNGHMTIPAWGPYIPAGQNAGFLRPVVEVAARGFMMTAGMLTGDIYIGEHVRAIRESAFEETHASSLTFAINETRFDAHRQNPATPSFVIEQNAFARNVVMGGEIIIPSHTEVISQRAFIENHAVTAIGMSSGTPRLTTIGASAFEGSYLIQEFFVLPRTLHTIGLFAFTLTNISAFETENDIDDMAAAAYHFRSGIGAYDGMAMFAVDGHLVIHEESNDRFSLMLYAPGAQDAVFNVGTLWNTLPELTHIGNYAFSRHEWVRSIVLPDAITLGHGVFAYAFSLLHVYVEHENPIGSGGLLTNVTSSMNAFYGLPSVSIRLVTIEDPLVAMPRIFLPLDISNVHNWRIFLAEQMMLDPTYVQVVNAGVGRHPDHVALDMAAAQIVINMITALGPAADLTIGDAAAVAAARDAFDDLTTFQQDHVTNIAFLLAAEMRIMELVLEGIQADVDAVVAMVAALYDRVLTLADEADVIAARAAFDALPEEAGLLVNLAGLDLVITIAEGQIQALHDQAAADLVIAMIDAIADYADIMDADLAGIRAAFNALTPAQRALVTNLADLVAAEENVKELYDQAAADIVIALIDGIADYANITDADLVAIRAAFDALTDAQRALVANIDDLYAAEELYYDTTRANAVLNLIMALDRNDLTIADLDDILAARAAFDALTTEQLELIDATMLLGILATAEQYVQDLYDTAAADIVIAMIDDILDADDDDFLDAVVAVRAAFDALTDDQQALVTNIDLLIAIEETIEELNHALAVALMIADLERVLTADDVDEVLAARAAFDALNQLQIDFLIDLDLFDLLEATLIDAEEQIADYIDDNGDDDDGDDD
ncbi:MAG: InlB B-repeat-containing protein [Firmicutes bacterium]|nr:InlB B-repeat-containing protein [Bacillota bacterium]